MLYFTCTRQDGIKLVLNNNIDFEKAIELSGKKFTYSELIELLKKESLVERQFAILNLEKLQTKEDGKLLCSFLTGQDGKIREAVSFRLAQFFNNQKEAELLSLEKNFEIMLEGIMDINGNVCRNILEIRNLDFYEFLRENLIPKIYLILDDISKLEVDDKQYVISKRNFQLYWALEALYNILDIIKFDEIEDILIKCAEVEDYTIKEKTAKIISRFDNNNNVEKIKKILRQNSNYYVERFLK